MLLKIERYIEEQDWWLLDSIRKISKAQFDVPDHKDFEDKEADVFIFDFMDHLESKGIDPFSRSVIRLICRLTNGDEYVVLLDTTAYLLNDNGKTIERMVANPRY